MMETVKDLWIKDPQLKYATGVMKGQPLDRSGLRYRIISYKGEEVALFDNGAMARFYRDTNPVSDGQLHYLDEAALRSKQAEERGAALSPETLSAALANFKPQDFVEMAALETPFILNVPRPKILGVFKTAEGLRPTGTHAVYCILEGGKQINIDRATVGTGLREFLWLYETLRGFGYGRFHALVEARGFYFL
jgi:hypothetical protein